MEHNMLERESERTQAKEREMEHNRLKRERGRDGTQHAKREREGEMEHNRLKRERERWNTLARNTHYTIRLPRGQPRKVSAQSVGCEPI